MAPVKPRRVPRRVAQALVLLLPLLPAAACSGGSDTPERPLMLRPNGDVLALGNTVSLVDSVPGDVMAAAGSITYSGSAGGSFLGVGGELQIRGRVQGSARGAAGNVVLDATVDRNATLVGGNVDVRDGARIERNAYLAAGRVVVSGFVGGDVYAGGGEVVLDGVIEGDARVEADRFVLGPEARIGGELRYRVGEGGAALDPSAVVQGAVRALPPPEEDDDGGVIWIALRMLAFVVVGTVLVALLPGRADELAEAVASRPGAAFGLGLLGLLLVPVAAVVAAVTVVGVPLAVITLLLYGVGIYVAPVVPAVWVGDELVPGPSKPGSKNRVLEFLAGALIVAFAIQLPWVGWVVRLLATALGFGAVALLIAAARRRPSEASAGQPG